MAQLLLPALDALAPLDEMSIRDDYGALLDRCARLMAYAQSSPHGFWPVVERQDRLAEDDLVTFALRARRFISATSLIPLAYNVLVPMGPLGRGEFQHMWRIITTIVHYTDLVIIRNAKHFEVAYRTLRERRTFSDFRWNTMIVPLRPIIFVCSDQHALSFDALLLLYMFLNKILHPAVISCQSRGVELADGLLHFDRAENYFARNPRDDGRGRRRAI